MKLGEEAGEGATVKTVLGGRERSEAEGEQTEMIK